MNLLISPHITVRPDSLLASYQAGRRELIYFIANDNAYGWKQCIREPKDRVFRIADAYNLLAIIFRSMEEKFALHRETSTDGSLNRYEDIEKRVKYDEKSKRDTGATDLLNKNASMGQEIRTRSNLDVDWSQAGRSVDLACEDRLNSSAIGMHCKPFRA